MATRKKAATKRPTTKTTSTKRQAPKTKTPRAKRPTPERTQPNRVSDAAFTSDNIAKSVKGAYEVIEQYMSEGQNIARELSKSYSNLTLDTLPDELQDLQANWLKASSQMLTGWVELVSKSAEQYTDAIGVEMPSLSASSSPVFTIKSAKSATVRGRLKSGAHRFEIKSGELSDGTRSIPFKVKNSSQGEVTVSITVGARQANGVYEGNLVNAVTGEILGDISLEVS